jgi:hypothetical protein
MSDRLRRAADDLLVLDTLRGIFDDDDLPVPLAELADTLGWTHPRVAFSLHRISRLGLAWRNIAGGGWEPLMRPGKSVLVRWSMNLDEATIVRKVYADALDSLRSRGRWE